MNSQIDIWDNCARVITPGSTHSPLLDYTPTQQEMLRALLDADHDAPVPEVPDGMHMREFMAARARDGLREHAGDKADIYCDAELVDSLDYTLFPNFHPWGAFNGIVYRFRPNVNDHRSAIMECIMLAPFQGERPPAAEVRWLEEGETWGSALGFLGKVFDQDSFNMPKVQAGLESTYQKGIILSGYQEAKVRWLHTKLTEWVGE